MSLACFFGHKWRARHVDHYYDPSFQPEGSKGLPSTSIVWMCSRCAQCKTQNLFGGGFIHLAQLQDDQELINSAEEKARQVLEKYTKAQP